MFTDQAHYHCIPLSRIGTSSASEIKTIRTSCPCVVASIVSYQENTSRSIDSLRIDFRTEIEGANSTRNASHLDVKIVVDLLRGVTCGLSVRYVNAFLLPEGESQ